MLPKALRKAERDAARYWQLTRDLVGDVGLNEVDVQLKQVAPGRGCGAKGGSRHVMASEQGGESSRGMCPARRSRYCSLPRGTPGPSHPRGCRRAP
jgi:hypothetical protein